MAASLTFLSSSPYHLKMTYLYDGNGGAQSGVALKTQVELIAVLASAGVLGQTPIRDLLNSITADVDWDALAARGDLSLYLTIGVLPAAGTGFSASFNSNGGRHLQVIGVDGNAGAAIVEIKYRPQLQRSQGPV